MSPKLKRNMQPHHSFNKRWTLEGYKAVVTGGTKGIGLACVREMLELGASVLLSSRTVDEVNALVDSLNAEFPPPEGGSPRVYGIVADGRKNHHCAAIIEWAKEVWDDQLDILVNNVGTNIRKATADVTTDDYTKILSTNLDSAFVTSQYAYPLLKNSKFGGSIVNIGSVAGSVALTNMAPYSMTKAAIGALTRSLACEWGRDGIRVNCVAPWYVETPLTQPVLTSPEYLRKVLACTPAGRTGKDYEVACLVAFLCMGGSKFISGQTIHADGGFTACGFWPSLTG